MKTTELLGLDGPDGVGETRPCVLCEYSHAMGNSNGNLHKYWEVGTNEASRTMRTVGLSNLSQEFYAR